MNKKKIEIDSLEKSGSLIKAIKAIKNLILLEGGSADQLHQLGRLYQTLNENELAYISKMGFKTKELKTLIPLEDGINGLKARQASLPCPISRLPGLLSIEASPTEYGGKL